MIKNEKKKKVGKKKKKLKCELAMDFQESSYSTKVSSGVSA